MKHNYLIFFLIFFTTTGFAQTLEGDRLALIDMYNTTGGAYWYNNLNWNASGNPGDSPCGWGGVTCNGEGTRVVKLLLPENDMLGSIPPSIGNLTALTHLDLSGAGREFVNLTGSIPAEIGNLTNLEYLDLSGNAFTGNNVAVIGNLIKLKHLALTPDWKIPAEFGYLVNLEYLYLSVQDASGLSQKGKAGALPSSFGNFTKLKTLDMHTAGLTGTIPASYSNLINLEFLDLHDNNLTGTFSSVSKLNKLTTLDLSYNGLSGKVPDLSEIAVSSNVYINNNQFTFYGMENNVSRLDRYQHQSTLILTGSYPLRAMVSLPSTFDVQGAYETIAHNIYKWYKDNSLFFTATGNYQCRTAGLGTYRVEVTNTFVPGLTLFSEEVVTDHIVMPVTLISFSGENKYGGITLTWKTSLEINNKGFEIERSEDAINFGNIGFIDGNSDSKASNDYNFLDKNPFAITYYRLKQIDWDGKFEYSKVIHVKQDNRVLSFYPNPAKNQLFVSGLEKEENVTIHNTEGRKILDQKISPSQPIHISTLSNGLYIIKIGNQTSKLVIQN